MNTSDTGITGFAVFNLWSGGMFVLNIEHFVGIQSGTGTGQTTLFVEGVNQPIYLREDVSHVLAEIADPYEDLAEVKQYIANNPDLMTAGLQRGAA